MACSHISVSKVGEGVVTPDLGVGSLAAAAAAAAEEGSGQPARLLSPGGGSCPVPPPSSSFSFFFCPSSSLLNPLPASSDENSKLTHRRSSGCWLDFSGWAALTEGARGWWWLQPSPNYWFLAWPDPVSDSWEDGADNRRRPRKDGYR